MFHTLISNYKQIDKQFGKRKNEYKYQDRFIFLLWMHLLSTSKSWIFFLLSE